MLIAELSARGFESFWESEEGLRAYIAPNAFDSESILELAERYQTTYRVQGATVEDWTPAQMDAPEPVWLAGGQVYIYGTDQPDNPRAKYRVQVDPRLSFGSGHHPTTALCVNRMLTQDWEGLSVLDVGTGSGILALLAEKLGAKSVIGFDNNPWAIEVARHNASLNDSRVAFSVSDPESFSKPYPRVLANLNGQVLRTSMEAVAALVAPGGDMLLGGYTAEVQTEIHALAEAAGLQETGIWVAEGWVASSWTR